MVCKLPLFTCYGGCATGVAVSKACIRLWEENPDDVRIGCLPAVAIPWTLKLVFDRKTQRLIGGQIISDAESPIKEIDAMTALILGGKMIPDLETIK